MNGKDDLENSEKLRKIFMKSFMKSKISYSESPSGSYSGSHWKCHSERHSENHLESHVNICFFDLLLVLEGDGGCTEHSVSSASFVFVFRFWELNLKIWAE